MFINLCAASEPKMTVHIVHKVDTSTNVE